MNDPKGLLRQCAQSLLNAVNRLENSTPGWITSTTHQVSAAEEHRNLFGYRPPCQSRSSNRPPPCIIMMATNTSAPRKHTFVCLMKKMQLPLQLQQSKHGTGWVGKENNVCKRWQH